MSSLTITGTGDGVGVSAGGRGSDRSKDRRDRVLSRRDMASFDWVDSVVVRVLWRDEVVSSRGFCLEVTVCKISLN